MQAKPIGVIQAKTPGFVFGNSRLTARAPEGLLRPKLNPCTARRQ
jgi:hypothetical protein